jgi:Peptidase family M48
VFPALLIVAAVAAGSVPAASALARARWPARSPAAAIVLWQALGLGWGLAAVGVLAGLGARSDHAGVALSALAFARQTLTGDGPGGLAGATRLGFVAASLVLFVLLVWVLVASSAAVLRARRRQRELLSLLGHGDPKVPGALVVDHPGAAAYCVPGLRSRIVVSAGTLELLDQAELAAVLAHERAHLRERHDLVLLPFTALLRAFRWSPAARDAAGSVALLLEMLADDHAVGYVATATAAGERGPGRGRQRPARPLATALLRVGAAGPATVPCGALAVADGGDVAVRVARLLAPPPGLRAAALALVGCTAFALVAVPAAFLLLSF